MIKKLASEMLARDENGHEHRLPDPGRRRPEDIDRRVGARLRERRIMLGLSQQQLADLIGVTLQQAYKYEKGINRVTSGRLYKIAQALDVDIGYFFDRAGTDDAPGRHSGSGCCWNSCATSWPSRIAGTERKSSRWRAS
jgi:transcriptional regulator with XRE-family HTH domain